MLESRDISEEQIQPTNSTLGDMLNMIASLDKDVRSTSLGERPEDNIQCS